MRAMSQGRRSGAGNAGRDGLLRLLAAIAICAAVILPAIHRHPELGDSRLATTALEASHASSPTASTSTDCEHDDRHPARHPQPGEPDCPICHWMHQAAQGLALVPPAAGVPALAPPTAAIAADREHPLPVHLESLGPARAPPRPIA